MTMLFTFMIAALTGFMLVIANSYYNAQQDKIKASIQDVKEGLEIELRIGAGAQDGFYRAFQIPQKASNLPIEVFFINSTTLGSPGSPANFSEVDLKFTNNSKPYETFIILPSNIDGNISIGHNEMRKRNGVLYLNKVE